jgi:hypothetical protein
MSASMTLFTTASSVQLVSAGQSPRCQLRDLNAIPGMSRLLLRLAYDLMSVLNNRLIHVGRFMSNGCRGTYNAEH